MQEKDNETKTSETKKSAFDGLAAAREAMADRSYDLSSSDKRAIVDYAIQTLYLMGKSLRGYALSDIEQAELADKEAFKARVTQARGGLISLSYAIDNEDW